MGNRKTGGTAAPIAKPVHEGPTAESGLGGPAPEGAANQGDVARDDGAGTSLAGASADPRAIVDIDKSLLEMTPADVAAAVGQLLQHDASHIGAIRAALLNDALFMNQIAADLMRDADAVVAVGTALINETKFLEALRLMLTPPDPDAEAKAAAEAERLDQAEKARADAKSAQKRAEREAEARDKAKRQAVAGYVLLMQGPAHPEIDLGAVRKAGLALGDGETFSIDFEREVEISDLSNVAGNVVLKHAPIPIGEGMPEAFKVTELVLFLGGDSDGISALALTCPLVQPMIVGGGNVAKIGENSLVFRRRHVATEAPEEAAA